MKKQTLLSAVVLLFSLHTHAQMFVLNNRSLNAPVFDTGGFRLSGTNYRAELWGGTTATSLEPAIEFTGLHQRYSVPFLTGTNAGFFVSGHAVFIPNMSVTFAWVQVRAWDARLGATYEAVEANGLGGYGESNIFYAQGGDPYLDGAPDTARLLFGLESFTLRPVVPEPSVVALVGLGCVSVWCFTRKR